MAVLLCVLLLGVLDKNTMGDGRGAIQDVVGTIESEVGANSFSRSYLGDIPGIGKSLLKLPKYPIYDKGDQVFITIQSKEKVLDSELKGYGEYLYSVGIKWIISSHNVSLIKKNENLVWRGISAIRLKMFEVFTRNLPKEEAGLSLGILIGGKESFSNSFKESLRRSGLSHIVSVSGYNFSVVFISLLYLKKFIPRWFSLVVSMIFILIFLLLVGVNNLPAVRSSLLIVIIAVGMIMKRRVNIYVALIVGVTVLMLFNPHVWKNISLQLSLVAFLGVILFTKRYAVLVPFSPGKNIISGTLAASVATLPITLSAFGGASLVSVLANLAVIPLIPVAMLSGVVSFLLSLLFPPLSNFFFWPTHILDMVILKIVRVLGQSWAYTEDHVLVITYSIFIIGLLIVGDYVLFKKGLNESR